MQFGLLLIYCMRAHHEHVDKTEFLSTMHFGDHFMKCLLRLTLLAAPTFGSREKKDYYLHKKRKIK